MTPFRKLVNTLGGTSCRHAHELMSERMERPLSTGSALRLRVHLTICVFCRRVQKQMEFMRTAMRRLGQ